MAAEGGGGSPARDAGDLRSILLGLDGASYRAYRRIEGSWRMGDFELRVDHVQGDPYAAPTRVSALVAPEVAALPPAAWRSAARARGTAGHLARAFADAARVASGRRSAGKGGEIEMDHPGQVTLPQTAVQVDDRGGVEARFTVGLPAAGRRIDGNRAADMLLTEVPRLVHSTLLAGAHEPGVLETHAAACEDAAALRASLREEGLVAFVADGSLLPRRSGIDDRPLAPEETVRFESPERLRVRLHTPNAGLVTGMGLPEGVTLIVGGGFHGKSTLLRALQAGVYDHPPGDGRELVVTRGDAVKVRAEDGRSVAGVDISGFVDRLPMERQTRRFTSPDASGSTSQAAAIVEALEAGSRLLLLDEDTSATNLLIRDRRMQLLVPAEHEPITPLVDRARHLHERSGVSLVLVLGGSGDYLDVADTVIRMVGYRAEDVTAEARRVAAAHPTGREQGHPSAAREPSNESDGRGTGRAVRRLGAGSIDARRGRRGRYVRVPDDRTLLLGDEAVDLVAVEQLASRAQTRAIGYALAHLAERLAEREASVAEALDLVEAVVSEGGLDALEPRRLGDLAGFRRHELAAALNRIRGLRVG